MYVALCACIWRTTALRIAAKNFTEEENRFFCDQCGTHTKLCRDKNTHVQSVFPADDQGEEETGEASLATLVTIKEYDQGDGSEEEW